MSSLRYEVELELASARLARAARGDYLFLHRNTIDEDERAELELMTQQEIEDNEGSEGERGRLLEVLARLPPQARATADGVIALAMAMASSRSRSRSPRRPPRSRSPQAGAAPPPPQARRPLPRGGGLD